MKRLLVLSLSLIALTTLAQKEVELQEVVVKGAHTVQRTDGQWIYPNRQQLESSTNGYSLLSKLTLPHLRVDPTTHSITSLSNIGAVQVRVNHKVASQEDLLSLDVQAVQRVEYIDNPGVRYGNDIACVVDIIVRESVSGYVIGTDLTNTLTAVNGKESVFGKVNHGKSEFGLNYTLDYQHLKGLQYDERATYELETADVRSIHRQQLDGWNKNMSHQARLTYSLSDSNYVFQAQLTANKDILPNSENRRIRLENATAEASLQLYTQDSQLKTTSPILDLYFHHDFTRHQSLTANIVGTQIKTDRDVENNEGSNYHYSVTGTTYSLWSETVYENRLKPFTLSGGIQHAQKYINNVYADDANAVNDIRSSNSYLFTQLKGHLGKLGYMIGMGMSNYYYRQDERSYHFSLFRPKLTLVYPIIHGLKLKYDFEESQHISQIALTSDVSIKQNALETLVGNPDIKPNQVMAHDLRLTYSTPRLTSELQGYYRRNADCNMEKYIRHDGHFYQTQDNELNECSFFFFQGYNRWEVIPEKLSATLYGGVYRFFNFTDSYRHTYTAFNGGASIEAYLGKWTLTGYLDSGWNFMEGEHRGHQAAAWYLTASYRMRRLTISLYAQHPFCANPLTNKTEVMSRYIRKEVSQHVKDFGNMLTLNLSWTFSSGRKYREIQRTMNHSDNDTGILSK